MGGGSNEHQIGGPGSPHASGTAGTARFIWAAGLTRGSNEGPILLGHVVCMCLLNEGKFQA
jgi:hypothetical protein